MKVTSIEIHPEGTTAVHVLSFRDPKRLNPYNCVGITGLDADEIAPSFYTASQFGFDLSTTFRNMTMPNREIAMKIELNPSFSSGGTYSSLKDDLMKIISASRTGLVQLQFKNGSTIVAAISGYIKKFENDLFNKQPGVTITMQTINPMLQAPELTEVLTADLNVDVEHLIGLKYGLNFSVTDDLSTAWHGFEIVMTVTTAFPELNITEPDVEDTDRYWVFDVIPTGGFYVDDEIHISSKVNAKEMYVNRFGSKFYMADAIQPGSIWPVMFPGLNDFQIVPGNKLTLESVNYYPTYWGV